jgi:hypothetical protein
MLPLVVKIAVRVVAYNAGLLFVFRRDGAERILIKLLEKGFQSHTKKGSTGLISSLERLIVMQTLHWRERGTMLLAANRNGAA